MTEEQKKQECRVKALDFALRTANQNSPEAVLGAAKIYADFMLGESLKDAK